MDNAAVNLGKEAMMGYGQIPQAPMAPSFGTLHGFAEATNTVDGKTFGETLANLVNSANNIMAEPERLGIEAVTTGNVDIHQVMIALGKSEVAFKLMTAVSQKSIGGLDKLMNMQI